MLIVPADRRFYDRSRICLGRNGTAEFWPRLTGCLTLAHARAIDTHPLVGRSSTARIARTRSGTIPAAHDIAVDQAAFSAINNVVGAGLPRRADNFARDLLVMGAYSHSRPSANPRWRDTMSNEARHDPTVDA